MTHPKLGGGGQENSPEVQLETRSFFINLVQVEFPRPHLFLPTRIFSGLLSSLPASPLPLLLATFFFLNFKRSLGKYATVAERNFKFFLF
jgi:hypothetical protein